MNKIEIINNNDDPLPIEILEQFINRILDELNIHNWDLPISFVSTDEIKNLNFKYRQKNTATDVLTFNAYEDGLFPNFEELNPGDIVISLNEVKNNCIENQIDLMEELQRVLVHSILHLIGENHSSYDFKKDPMLIKQEILLKKFAIKGEL